MSHHQTPFPFILFFLVFTSQFLFGLICGHSPSGIRGYNVSRGPLTYDLRLLHFTFWFKIPPVSFLFAFSFSHSHFINLCFCCTSTNASFDFSSFTPRKPSQSTFRPLFFTFWSCLPLCQLRLSVFRTKAPHLPPSPDSASTAPPAPSIVHPTSRDWHCVLHLLLVWRSESAFLPFSFLAYFAICIMLTVDSSGDKFRCPPSTSVCSLPSLQGQTQPRLSSTSLSSWHSPSHSLKLRHLQHLTSISSHSACD